MRGKSLLLHLMELTKLKEIRKMRKIKIKDLVLITGIPRNAIADIERGRGNPSFERVRLLADAMSVRIVIAL